MKKIIDPVSKEILKSQLTQDKLLRTTNHGGNEIYVVDNENAPDVIREIGRLREEAFRAGGGGHIHICALQFGRKDTKKKPHIQIYVELSSNFFHFVTKTIDFDSNQHTKQHPSHIP